MIIRFKTKEFEVWEYIKPELVKNGKITLNKKYSISHYWILQKLEIKNLISKLHRQTTWILAPGWEEFEAKLNKKHQNSNIIYNVILELKPEFTLGDICNKLPNFDAEVIKSTVYYFKKKHIVKYISKSNNFKTCNVYSLTENEKEFINNPTHQNYEEHIPYNQIQTENDKPESISNNIQTEIPNNQIQTENDKNQFTVIELGESITNYIEYLRSVIQEKEKEIISVIRDRDATQKYLNEYICENRKLKELEKKDLEATKFLAELQDQLIEKELIIQESEIFYNKQKDEIDALKKQLDALKIEKNDENQQKIEQLIQFCKQQEIQLQGCRDIKEENKKLKIELDKAIGKVPISLTELSKYKTKFRK